MNHYEQIDWDAIQEAEAILNGTIPSSPETYAMVQKFYGQQKAQALGENIGCQMAGRSTQPMRSEV